MGAVCVCVCVRLFSLLARLHVTLFACLCACAFACVFVCSLACRVVGLCACSLGFCLLARLLFVCLSVCWFARFCVDLRVGMSAGHSSLRLFVHLFVC